MKTICLDARMYHSGGIGTYIRNLIPFIKGVFRLILLGDPEELGGEGCEIIPFHAPIYSIEEQARFPFVIPACDLFWSPHYNVPFLPVRAEKRVVTIHDVYHLAYAHSLKFAEKYYAKAMMQRATGAAEKIITVSHFSAHEIAKYTKMDEKKISVIYSGIDQRLFSPASSKERPNERFFLFVGNFKPHKNLKNLLLAFHLFLQEQPSAHLFLIGKNRGLRNQESFDALFHLYPALESRAKILEDVTNEELPRFYAAAEGLVFPSFYEGFGFPPLEAMACGCPVIVSNIEVHREICRTAALFADPHDPSSIQEKMGQLWDRKDLALETKGKNLAASFSWEKAAQKHVELFDAVC